MISTQVHMLPHHQMGQEDEDVSEGRPELSPGWRNVMEHGIDSANHIRSQKEDFWSVLQK